MFFKSKVQYCLSSHLPDDGLRGIAYLYGYILGLFQPHHRWDRGFYINLICFGFSVWAIGRFATSVGGAGAGVVGAWTSTALVSSSSPSSLGFSSSSFRLLHFLFLRDFLFLFLNLHQNEAQPYFMIFFILIFFFVITGFYKFDCWAILLPNIHMLCSAENWNKEMG